MGNHALLSASSSHRWLNCPPSARLGENYEDRSSDFAAEGTDAHSLCEFKLRTALGEEAEDPVESLNWYNAKVQVFNNSDFGSVRTTTINGEPFFVGKDVAEILGYSNPRDAISNHVEDEDKGVAKCDTLGGIQELTVINESGLYSLILSSKLPKAKQFKH